VGEKSENEAGQVIGIASFKQAKLYRGSMYQYQLVELPGVSIRSAEIGYNMHDEDMTIRYKD
jgi:hypothetical protein